MVISRLILIWFTPEENEEFGSFRNFFQIKFYLLWVISYQIFL